MINMTDVSNEINHTYVICKLFRNLGSRPNKLTEEKRAVKT
jgi:hypothetical protein